jgi:hypothetical protein
LTIRSSPDASAMATSYRGQTVKKHLQPLQKVAGRLGWSIVAISTATRGSAASLGRQKRPGLGALLKSVARREFDIAGACRCAGRSVT